MDGRSKNVAVAAIIGAAGGLALGLFLSSSPAAQARKVLLSRVRSGTQRIEGQLHSIERQLRELDETIQESRRRFAERLQGASQKEAGWEVSGGDVVRELPHLPRK